MELLLNLIWLLLVVLAVSAWQRYGRRSEALRSLLGLTCLAVLLFPVISATDDLHAVRTDMEESSSAKRIAKQVESKRDPANGHADPLAHPVRSFSLLPNLAISHREQSTFAEAIKTASSVFAERSPPLSSSFLATL